MKQLYGTNIQDKNHPTLDREGYETRKVSQTLINSMNDAYETADGLEQKAQLPLWLSIVNGIAWLIMICSALALVRVYSFTEPILTFLLRPRILNVTIAFLVSVVIRLVLSRVKKHLENQVVKEEASIDLESRATELLAQSDHELGIIPEATQIDGFDYHYKPGKNGEIKLQSIVLADYMLFPCTIFIENNCLIVSNTIERFDIPLTDIREFRTVKKKCCITDWRKATRFDKGEYKPYKIYSDNLGRIWMKGYGQLTFQISGEEFQWRIPIYEVPVVEQVLGRTAAPKEV